MRCRNCGTEIADKALICFRCGTATTEPAFKPVPIRGKRPSSLLSILALVLLIVLALYMGRMASGEVPRAVSWAAAAAALVLVVLQVWWRRRR
jgi:hypothetical protein